MKAQTVIPKAVREALGIGPGDEIGYTIHDRWVVLTALGKPLSREDPFACFGEWASRVDTEGYASI